MRDPYDRIVPVILVMNDEYWLPYCLEATRGHFGRYVIYDSGSTDGTVDVIKWFIESMKGEAEFFVRSVPALPPSVQGIFRNSMIAEARADWYMILDADEIYTSDGFEAIKKQLVFHERKFDDGFSDEIYGIVPRVEVAGDLQLAYGIGKNVPHHRIYHRTAIWTGPHPGEVPLYEQNKDTERWYSNVTCYHFHNSERSREDAAVPKRLERRARGTYRPGEPEYFHLFEALPLLKTPIEDFPRNPVLKEMQEALGS